MAFQKGQGGRPRGAGNKATVEVRSVLDRLARDKGKKDLHLERLHLLTQSEDPHVAVKALTVALAYRYGKPTEHVALSGEGGGPVVVKFIDAAGA